MPTPKPVVNPQTEGVSPKVPVQAIATLVVAAIAYLGVELSPEVSAALGVLVGAVLAYFAPPGTITAGTRRIG